MTASSRIRAEIRKRVPIQNVPTVPHEHLRSTWKQARPGRIRASFDVAQSQDPGGWYVVGRSGDVGTSRSVTRTIAGREIVLWRDEAGTLMAGPGTCPHLGALLDDCEVIRGDVVCRWHGMALGAAGARRAGSRSSRHDDGVLAWVRLPTPGETPTDRPTLTTRPPLDASIAAVIEIPGVCEPEDIIANRLDPWHGAWYHPYAFSHLVVDDDASDDNGPRRRRDVPAHPAARRPGAGGVRLPRRADHRHDHRRRRGRRQRRRDPRDADRAGPVRPAPDDDDRGDHRPLAADRVRHRPVGRGAGEARR